MHEKVTLSFEPDFVTRMKRNAEESGRTVSGLVRVAVKRYLKGDKDG